MAFWSWSYAPARQTQIFFEVAKMHTFAQRIRLQITQQAVHEAMQALMYRRAVAVTGVTNKVMAIAGRFIPRVIMLEVLGSMFGKMYHQQSSIAGNLEK